LMSMTMDGISGFRNSQVLVFWGGWAWESERMGMGSAGLIKSCHSNFEGSLGNNSKVKRESSI
jgi:hypothetical protein